MAKGDNKGQDDDPNIVHATPTKRFFVDMLTRDIGLSDALLDLLDNCIDGVVRSLKKAGKPLGGDAPYAGFSAHVTISPDEVKNCQQCVDPEYQ